MGGFGPSQMEMQQLAMLRQQQQAQPQGSPQYSDQMVRPSEEALSRIRAYQSSDEGKRKIAEAIARMQHPKYNSMTNTKVNAAGNYTKPELRKRLFNSIKAANTQGTGAGRWSARKAQLLAKRYKAAGGGYRD
jgi:hypothetical protein